MDILHFIEFAFIVIVGWTLSAMVLPRISLVSFRRRLFDSVDERKLHTAHIPRLGGIAFFPCITVTVSLAIIGYNLWQGYNILDMDLTNRLLSMLCCLFILYLIGMMDDLIGVRYRSKFVVQILCGILLVISGLCFDNLYGLFGIYVIPYYIGVPFTVFVIVYILNAINLIDGIDGLASGLSIISFLAFSCMFIHLQWWMYAFISLAAFSVLLPFFYYNVYGKIYRGRKIFMGDTGSLALGGFVASTAYMLQMPLIILIVAFIYLAEVLSVIIQVVSFKTTGKRVFKMAPIHHHFELCGWPETKVVAIFSIVTTILCLIGILAI